MRTYSEILQSIIDEKNANPETAALNNSSSTAIWYLWANIAASAIFVFEQIFYKEKEELTALTLRRKYGTVPWYALIASEFQYGHTLVFNEASGTFGYAVVDESAQIIARATARENTNLSAIQIKVAKNNASGTALEPLSSAEFIAFQDYMDKVGIAGVLQLLVNENADIVNIQGDVYYDQSFDVSSLKTSINEALNELKINFSFDGILLRNDIIEAIRNVPGVADFKVISLSATPYGGTTVIVEREYATYSGYFNYSAALPADNFNYIGE
jgi:hypothetical protein